MPIILSRHEIALTLLHAVQGVDTGKKRPMAMMTMTPVALTQTATGLAAGVVRPQWDTHTAIVNLVQSASQQGVSLNNREIYSTVPPSAACLGIAKLMRMRAIYFFDEDRIYKVDLQADTGINLAPTAPLGAVANTERLTGMPNELSVANVVNAQTPEERAQFAIAWYWELHQRWGALKPHQQPALLASLDALTTWTGVPRLPMAGVPLAGGGGIMRTNYADQLFMTLAYVLATRGWGDRRALNLVPAGHHIAAVLASYDGTIHGWGVNYNSLDSTRHAETNLIQSFGREIPANATLYTTLQSCFMCAGLFVHAGGQRCVYGQKDPTMDGKTALVQNETHANDQFNGVVAVGPTGPRVVSSSSMGTHLEAVRTGMINTHPEVRLVPNFLQKPEATHIYSYAGERLVNLARAANRPAEFAAWENIVKLLRTRGLRLPSAQILGDDVRRI